ncbi:MAG: hypothetical protein ACXV3D_10310 [Halobacteriota archaeon]
MAKVLVSELASGRCQQGETLMPSLAFLLPQHHERFSLRAVVYKLPGSFLWLRPPFDTMIGAGWIIVADV